MHRARPPVVAALLAALIITIQLPSELSAHPTGATKPGNLPSSVASALYSTVGGGRNNSATGPYSTVAGGDTNRATGGYSFIGGGQHNWANGSDSTIGGGYSNKVVTKYCTVGGGAFNTAAGETSTVGGGRGNVATNYGTVAGGDTNAARGLYSTVGGGFRNNASGSYATIPGGSDNVATNYAFAAGVRAKATNVGSFVWNGVNSVDTVSTNNNSFTVRAPGGVRFITSATATNFTPVNPILGVILRPLTTAWTALSDRESKTDFRPIKPREVLAKLAAMPVTSWRYKHDPSRRYIGPTSQDFMEAFHLGDYDKGINTLDADGVTFAAIQGLVEELKDKDEAIEELSAKIEAFEQLLGSLPPTP